MGVHRDPNQSRWELVSIDGASPVAKELDKLPDHVVAELMGTCADFENEVPLPAGTYKKLTNSELHQLKCDVSGQAFRLLFAIEGDKKILLALHAFEKKSKKGIKTPPKHERTANRRLKDWRKA